MSLPYLLNDPKGYVSASQRIPVIARPFVSEGAKKTLDLVSSVFPRIGQSI
jgi:acyl-CoA dehydrogenase